MEYEDLRLKVKCICGPVVGGGGGVIQEKTTTNKPTKLKISPAMSRQVCLTD